MWPGRWPELWGALAAVAIAAAGPAAIDAVAAASPTVATGGARATSPREAVVEGSVNPNGSETSAAFQYGTSSAYGLTSPSVDLGAGSTPEQATATLTGLAFGTVYHYRVQATNAFGEAVGADATFRTPDAVISGGYGVTLRVTSGGRPFGQHRGEVVRRQYRFAAHCVGGLCGRLHLRRQALRGTFASTLRRHAGERYQGNARFGGRCTDGERFHGVETVQVEPSTVLGDQAVAVSGVLRLRARGCVRGRELARFSGELAR